MTNEIPQTLTLDRCNCGSPTCERFGFTEGHFAQGTGFDKVLATEVKNRYDSHDQLLARISELESALESVIEGGRKNWLLFKREPLARERFAELVEVGRQALRGTNTQPIPENVSQGEQSATSHYVVIEGDAIHDESVLNDLDTLLEAVAERR